MIWQAAARGAGTLVPGVTTPSPEPGNHSVSLRLKRSPWVSVTSQVSQEWGHRWVQVLCPHLLLPSSLLLSAPPLHPYPRGRAWSFKSLLPGQPFYERPHGGHMCTSCSPCVWLPHPQSRLGRVSRGGHGQLVTASWGLAQDGRALASSEGGGGPWSPPLDHRVWRVRRPQELWGFCTCCMLCVCVCVGLCTSAGRDRDTDKEQLYCWCGLAGVRVCQAAQAVAEPSVCAGA